MPYTIEEHKHRFSAWAAGRAASVKGCRFSVEQAKKIIEAADLNKLLVDPSNLPLPQEVDARHENWRKDIILKAEGLGLKFTHGVAAKLINIYLKAGFVCGGHHAHANVKALHPPIDNVLLDELFAKNIGDHRCVWNEAKIIRWSKLNSVQYQKIIDEIRNSMPNQALWEVEQYWRGYQ
ncbi:hypothetical protein [Brachymonas sp.]|uniref:hypothetical protein n=1 Tax=Brachymonas sp. TaxID=1936292 RepID=UPI0035B2A6DE